MLYNYLKIFHILTASLLLSGMLYTVYRWLKTDEVPVNLSLVIIPFTIIQLLTGFTMISLKRSDFSAAWISSVIIGFICVIVTWISFTCYQRARLITVSMGSLALLSIIFLMVSKT